MFHSFHIVTLRPWPFICGRTALTIIISFVVFLKSSRVYYFLITFSFLFLFSFIWWRDVARERAFHGDHTNKVQDGLKWGIALFIFREVMFFFAWFWAFFHSRRAPTQELGQVWPPLLISPFDPFSIPLLNTAILLSSGVFVTWAHHNLVINQNIFTALFLTILFGLIFTGFQAFEYKNSQFSICDRVYGTTFFVSTGFHGAHVIVGRLFLLVNLYRESKTHFIQTHHIGVEFRIWYWHFVDVVWLFLFSFIYWWGW